MVKSLRFGLCVALGLASAPALADDAACLDAATKGQRFRDTHKLLEARDELRACAAVECPAVVESDCAAWLASVEKALPSVVLTAKDDAGASLIEVQVTVDGQPFATRLDGQSLPIDPGPHRFRFEGPGGATLEQLEVVPEGEQNHRVGVVLAKNVARPLAGQNATAAGPSVADPGPSPATGGGPWRAIGWVTGAVGVVGLGVGAAFAVVAMSDHDAAHCNASHVCLTGPLADARRAATVADVGLIAGGALTAVGLGLVVFVRPSVSLSEERPVAHATVGVSPLLTPGGGGLEIGGTW